MTAVEQSLEVCKLLTLMYLVLTALLLETARHSLEVIENLFGNSLYLKLILIARIAICRVTIFV